MCIRDRLITYLAFLQKISQAANGSAPNPDEEMDRSSSGLGADPFAA